MPGLNTLALIRQAHVLTVCGMARSEKAQRSEKSSDDNQRSGGEIIDPDQILLGGEESRQESRLTQEIQRDYRTIRTCSTAAAGSPFRSASTGEEIVPRNPARPSRTAECMVMLSGPAVLSSGQIVGSFRLILGE